MGAKVNTGIGVVWTTEMGRIVRSAGEISNISFYSNNNSTATSARMAIRLDVSGVETWFVTEQTFIRNSSTAGDSTNFAANGELESFSFVTDAASWRSLTFVPGSSLVLGTTLVTDLPQGDLTAAGIYFNSTSTDGRTIRYDNFVIETVPEASSSLMIMLGLLGLAQTRRR